MLRFGTDGVRGDAERELTSEFVVALGRAVAVALDAPTLLIGRDTRESGERIEADFARGLALQGVTAVTLDVAPTPAIAFHAARAGMPAAIVSASHNPWRDNGVKVIGADGRKLSDAAEEAIEVELERFVADPSGASASAPAATLTELAGAADAYVEHLVGVLGGRDLAGLSVVLDCANGAASGVGPRALRAAGADVHVLHCDPDGRNINDGCGSTHPEELRAALAARGAGLGLAFDGDADRVLAVDERGSLVDGDQLLVMLALDLHERGRLRNDAIAVTVMSNLGLRRALRARGVDVVETPVGDRYVVEAMREHDLVLGGEQSGHIIVAEHATTGDGVLTGLLVADLVARTGRPLSALAATMTRVPQVLVNVRLRERVDLATVPAVAAAVAASEQELGESGRVLVRSSGTEPLVRIMVEADGQSVADAHAARLRSVVEAELGAV